MAAFLPTVARAFDQWRYVYETVGLGIDTGFLSRFAIAARSIALEAMQ